MCRRIINWGHPNKPNVHLGENKKLAELINSMNLGKLVENNSSKTTRRKQLAENNWSKILGRKLVEKQLAENDPAENSSQEQKIISDKYSANLVIVLCYQVRT